jgi:hypothetical protein
LSTDLISLFCCKAFRKYMLGFLGADGEVVLIGPDQKVPDGGPLY